VNLLAAFAEHPVPKAAAVSEVFFMKLRRFIEEYLRF